MPVLSNIGKAWNVIYLTIAAFCVAFLIGAVFFFLAVAVSCLSGSMGWHLGEYGLWLPLIGLEYGFLLGLIPGAIMGRKFYRSRLQDKQSG